MITDEILVRELRAELVVDVREFRDRPRLDVPAARVACEPLQRRELREARPQADREDPDMRPAGGGGCARLRLVVPDIPVSALFLSVGENDQGSGTDVRRAQLTQRLDDRVVDVRPVDERRLLREGRVDLRLVGCKRQNDGRRDVVRDQCQLLLAFALRCECSSRGERRSLRVSLHARARVDHEHDTEVVRSSLGDRND